MLTSFVFALQMLTRIQIGNLPFDERKYGRGSMFFPVIGTVLGLLLYILYLLTDGNFPDMVRGSFLLTVLVVLTGGLHADGLMDSVDALFSGRTRERKLEILKDVHAGAFGVVAVATAFILKYSLITGLLNTDQIGWLFIFPTTARWAMVYMIRFFPYLWNEGLGTAFSKYTGPFEFTLATVFLGLVTAFFWSWQGIIVLGVITVLIHLWGRRVVRALGGVTGDIYGATAEIFEIVTLIFLYLFPSRI